METLEVDPENPWEWDFDDSYNGDRKPCDCCGSPVEYRHGTALHHTCIECSKAGCGQFESHCERSKQTTLAEVGKTSESIQE